MTITEKITATEERLMETRPEKGKGSQPKTHQVATAANASPETRPQEEIALSNYRHEAESAAEMLQRLVPGWDLKRIW